MNAKTIRAFFTILRTANPEPKSELLYSNTFTLLVAVVLSAQATDKGVNKATEALFKAADTPEKMVALSEDRLDDYLKTINFHRTKARNVLALSRLLIERHGGEVPQSQEDLVALPGVGHKTAGVVRNSAFGHPVIAVDTHIFRVSNRTGLAPGETVEKVTERLEQVVPDEFKLHAHHWLILHGRYICKARKPDCAVCPVYKQCGYAFKTA
jgi:endonuclease-3